MTTWADQYHCTDCGRGISSPGTCTECQVRNQPAAKDTK